MPDETTGRWQQLKCTNTYILMNTETCITDNRIYMFALWFLGQCDQWRHKNFFLGGIEGAKCISEGAKIEGKKSQKWLILTIFFFCREGREMPHAPLDATTVCDIFGVCLDCKSIFKKSTEKLWCFHVYFDDNITLSIQSLFPYYKKHNTTNFNTTKINNIWRSNQKANEARKRLPLWNKNSYIT